MHFHILLMSFDSQNYKQMSSLHFVSNIVDTFVGSKCWDLENNTGLILITILKMFTLKNDSHYPIIISMVELLVFIDDQSCNIY